MQSMGTAYYNGALYKHRLPPFIEWHSQISRGLGAERPKESLGRRVPKGVWGGKPQKGPARISTFFV